ncbi:hypothetical protein V5O49_00150, partial [Isoptericola sp. MSP01]
MLAADRDGLLARLRELRTEFQRLRLIYQIAIEAGSTTMNILRQEHESNYDYSPIEHQLIIL